MGLDLFPSHAFEALTSLPVVHILSMVGQSHAFTPYMIVYLVISLPKIRCKFGITVYTPYLYGSFQP